MQHRLLRKVLQATCAYTGSSLGERACFVAANDIQRAQRLNSRQLPDDRVVLGHDRRACAAQHIETAKQNCGATCRAACPGNALVMIHKVLCWLTWQLFYISYGVEKHSSARFV